MNSKTEIEAQYGIANEEIPSDEEEAAPLNHNNNGDRSVSYDSLNKQGLSVANDYTVQ